MDVERRILSRIIADGTLGTVIDQKITADFFVDDLWHAVFYWMNVYWLRHKESPTADALQRQYPAFRPVAAPEPLSYYIEELKKEREHVLLVEMLQEAGALIQEDDPHAALEVVQLSISKISTEITELRDDDQTETWEDRLKEYTEISNRDGGLRGIPTGFSLLDRATGGYQKEQFVIITGLPKVGKSTIALSSAMAAHDKGNSVLWIGWEMSNSEQAARRDSFLARMDHRTLLDGSAGPADLAKLKKALRLVKNRPPFILSADTSRTTTISGVAAKIRQYTPDIVFLDGMYMMEDEQGERYGSPAALTNLTRGCKKLAMIEGVPIVATTQSLEWKTTTNTRGGPRVLNAGSLGYSSSFTQDADVVIGVEETENPSRQRVKIILARNAPRTETYIHWDWANGDFQELTHGEQEAEQKAPAKAENLHSIR